MNEMDDVVNDFLVESHEGLDRLDRDLVRLEKDPHCRDTLSSVFRTIHTIKGTCGFLGFSRLEKVAHAGENLLSRLRDGELVLDPAVTTALLQTVDAVREMLAHVAAGGTDGDETYPLLIETLEVLQRGGTSSEPLLDALTDLPAAPFPTAPHPTVQTQVESAAHPESSAAHLMASAARAPATDDAQRASGPAQPADSTIRVDVGLLDSLMNMVGELVLARNQILQFTSTQDDTTFLATCQRLNLITTELQEGVMKTRMQPIGNVWGKFPRVVRDLAHSCGKQVRIEMEGKETELDKTIIEAIKDPLTHIVRNAIDHGIETPAERIAAGKAPEGVLRLRAFHEGGQVNIEIADDGAGLKADRIKAKALERGLVTVDQVAKMSERDLVQLVFQPGFSTAAAVTNISGRGVGMDVVRTNIERIGGVVDLTSFQGRGSTLRIKIPLTLAIIPALVVTCGRGRYAIPQVSLLELVRLEGEQIQKRVESIRGAPVYRLRGRLLPLVKLHEQLKVAPSSDGDTMNIVILQADGRQFGLVVDAINDTEEIVVKPLGKHMKGIPAFAGATIMGDGKVALILDVLGLARSARVVTERGERALEQTAEAEVHTDDQKRTLLLVQAGTRGRMAIPLSDVARLEELPQDSIEWTGAKQVVQYRGKIMPLVWLSEELGRPRLESEPDVPLQVVVYADAEQPMGIVVDRILDIVHERVELQGGGRSRGLIGRAVVQGKVTDLLDVAEIVSRNSALVGQN